MAARPLATMKLQIYGLGIVMYSPAAVAHIAQGDNYLESHYLRDEDVQEHLQKGSLVGFGTGSPGRYRMRFHADYPAPSTSAQYDHRLRLGLVVAGGVICVRDLYDLLEWDSACPRGQSLEVSDGIYHVTVCTKVPASGILGDDQVIDVFLQPLDRFPSLQRTGIPTLS